MSKDLDKNIYLLYHLYEFGEDNENEESKILGIYSSEEKVYEAIERYYKLDGFNKYPKTCFMVDEYNVDVDTGWKEGFVNSDDLDQDFEKLTNIFNEWLNNNKNAQESWENTQYYDALCDVSKVMYRIKDVKELAESIQQIWTRRFNDQTKKFNDYITIAINIIQIL